MAHRQGFYEKYIKRPQDFVLATAATVVLSPVMLATGLLVKKKLGTPVIFSQERPGLNGKIFKLHKFRSMTDERDEKGNLLPDDVRLTSFGKKLRSTSLDELPELFNIIKGDMSVVGPRPLLVRYLDRYNAHQARRHEVRPGFTGLAQVHGRNAISWEEKFDWDVKYVDHVSFLGDWKIIFDTVKTVLKHEGISSGTTATMEEFMGSPEAAGVVKKICYITTIGATIKVFFIPQLKALSECGLDVSVICSNDDGLKELLGESIHYIPIDIPRGMAVIPMIRAYFQVKKQIQNDNYDLVQYSTPNAGLCGALASKMAGVKVRNYHLMGLRYLGETGVKRKILKALERVTCSLSTNIECVSNSNLQMAVEEKLFPKEKGTVVFYGSSGGVDTKRFCINKRPERRHIFRQQFALTDTEFVFLFMGRVTRDKGINELLSAFSELHNAKLLIVGPLENTSLLDPNLYEASLNNANVIYVGLVENVEDYYAMADCLVLPSYREGFGNVIIEAAAMGTPAIVSSIPGPIDAVIPDKTALVIPPKDVNALKDAMNKMMTLDYIQMGREAAEFAQSHFDSDLLCEKILERKRVLLNDKTIIY